MVHSASELDSALYPTAEEWKAAIDKQFDDWWQARLNNNKNQLSTYQLLIKNLQKLLEKGEASAHQVQNIIDITEQRIAHLQQDNVILRCCRYRLGGQFPDVFERGHATQTAFLDNLIARLTIPDDAQGFFKQPGVGRNPSAQERFRKDLIRRYDSEASNGDLWCPISRNFINSNATRAAHLVAHNIGESNCNYIFGTAEDPHKGHLMSHRNGILMARAFEEALDKANIIMAPAQKGDIDLETQEEVDFTVDKCPLKIVVLNRKWLDEKSGRPIGSVKADWLDGRILQFRNDSRPEKRYLFFLALMSIARRQRCRVPGWQKDIDYLESPTWASPRERIKKSTVYTIMEQVGLDSSPVENLTGGVELWGDSAPTEYDEEIAARVYVTLWPPKVQNRRVVGTWTVLDSMAMPPLPQRKESPGVFVEYLNSDSEDEE